ncbi:unnamed protein product [Orchesella dallaii]|uniref:RHD domain-containing protein n=1 Tax=Orchesella dallaii TaxID=48710 RepID=A0ABP1QP00_9HEXA
MEWETTYAGAPRPFHQKQPFLEIFVQPQPKFRFRYRSEMTGKHGSLLGSPSTAVSSMKSTSQLGVGVTSGMYPASGIGSSSNSYGIVSSDVVSGSASGHVQNIEGTSNFPSSASSTPIISTPMQGPSASNGSKLYPTVKLHNFPSDAILRCSLVCDTPPYYPHPHLLEMGHGTGGDDDIISRENCYVEIPVTARNDHTAVFQGLNIIYVSKKGIRKQLVAKMSQLGHGDGRRVGEERIDDLSLGVNLNVVALYFEAFVRDPLDPRNSRMLCPAVVSNPIQHNKSTQTGELRIVRIDKHASCCTGDEEVFILVEKVDKHNIQVKFYQENDQGQEIWKAYGKFSKLDVHHQYAIVFKTPPYRSSDIDTEVEVQVQLERPSDSATSASLPFIYKPIERCASSFEYFNFLLLLICESFLNVFK